jgi:hypothetical protein
LDTILIPYAVPDAASINPVIGFVIKPVSPFIVPFNAPKNPSFL